MEVAQCTDDTVAGLGEILKSFHDGGAELPPIGGVVIVAGGRGSLGAGTGGSEFTADEAGWAGRRVV
jgi:hypothetical protein